MLISTITVVTTKLLPTPMRCIAVVVVVVLEGGGGEAV